MREILFKAKRVDNGKWVAGYYTFNHQTDRGMIFDKQNLPCIVIPETVCQLAKEHEGVKIFENDKLYVHFPEGWQGEDFSIEDGETRELIVSFNDGWFLTDSFDQDVFIFFGQLDCMPLELKIIGNIHD